MDPLRRQLIELVQRIEARRTPTSVILGGRWHVVERFTIRDRRFVVACTTDPAILTGHEALSPLENEVVAHALLQESNKVIAYNLGRSDSTVRVVMSRVARKLGVKGRAGVIRALSAHERVGEEPDRGGPSKAD